jgi:hypothetical protein
MLTMDHCDPVPTSHFQATLYDGDNRLMPNVVQNYFGVMGKNLTDPFTRGLNATSWDGGVVWLNVPVAAKPYVVRATKPGMVFSEAWMQCHTPNRFINAAPTQGPHVIRQGSVD